MICGLVKGKGGFEGFSKRLQIGNLLNKNKFAGPVQNAVEIPRGPKIYANCMQSGVKNVSNISF